MVFVPLHVQLLVEILLQRNPMDSPAKVVCLLALGRLELTRLHAMVHVLRSVVVTALEKL